MLAAAEGQGRLDVTPYRVAIDGVFAFDDFGAFGFVHYRDAWAWRHEVEAVLEDHDGLLEVIARDQSSGYAFLRIAQACRAHGRDVLALDWAEDFDRLVTETRTRDKRRCNLMKRLDDARL